MTENDLHTFGLERDRFIIEHIKAILALASGTLIVTLSFLSGKVELAYKGLLWLAWLYLLLSILFGMWAMSAGAARYDNAIKGKTGELVGKAKLLFESGKVLTPFEAQTPAYQQWFFTLGLLGFFAFVVLNTHGLITW